MLEGLKQHYVNLLTSGGHLVLLFAGWQIDSKEAWPILLGLISLISFFAWIGNQRRSRLILDTPTSRIASAAQGYVELTGRARQAHDIPLLSKLTLLPCVWYRYIIEQERSDNKGYDIVEQGTSDDTILIDDGSGQCFVDPDYAEVITSHKQVWKKGDYRYTEYLLSPLDTLYAIGEFTTLGGANSQLSISRTTSTPCSQNGSAIRRNCTSVSTSTRMARSTPRNGNSPCSQPSAKWRSSMEKSASRTARTSCASRRTAGCSCFPTCRRKIWHGNTCCGAGSIC